MSEQDDRDAGVTSRLLRAGEVLASAHAKRAKEEAARDAGRIGGALGLLAAAALLLVPACLLAHFALVVWLRDRFALALAPAAGAVAAGDVLCALLLALVARAKLAPPVLAETRATLKRAAEVWRG